MTRILGPQGSIRARGGKALLALLVGALVNGASSGNALATETQPSTAQRASIAGVPLNFERNLGQAQDQVQFLAHGQAYAIELTKQGAALAFGGKSPKAAKVIHLRVQGADSHSLPTAEEPLPGRVNYFIGNDPSKWHTDIRNYAKIDYRDVYQGIDLVYHGDQKQLEYDFVVAPGADPHSIRLAFDGTQGKTIDAQGNLVLHTTGGDLVEHAPVAYQVIHGVRHSVSAHFLLGRNGRVGFQVGHYDHSRPLVIDPVLSYSTYLGGSETDNGFGIAVDSAGNAYITGDTASTNFPTRNPLQPHLGGQKGFADAFVAKLNPAGSALVYSTYLGGKFDDSGEGIAVDSAGNAFVTGWTSSNNFPTKNAYQATNGGLDDVFMAKLNAAGSKLLYSTYLGGSSLDQSHAIAVDSSGKVYVTGTTVSLDFPTVHALQSARAGGSDGFVGKFDPSLVGESSLIYSTFLGGSTNPGYGEEMGTGIAADSLGNAYVTGRTDSADFPTTIGAFQTAFGDGVDAFVTKINAAGSALVYSTFLGGAGIDRGFGIALDRSGNAYVTGETTSANFPSANALQSARSGGSDAFVTQLSADGSGVVYSTYLGGNGYENAAGPPRIGGITVDAFGNAFVTGNTSSTDFPTVNAFQATYGGGSYDAFVAELTSSATALVYSSYLGGNSTDQTYGIAVDGSGNAYVTGSTSSTNFPTKNPLQPHKAGSSDDAFVTKIASN